MSTEELIAVAEELLYECRVEDGWLICDHFLGARASCSLPADAFANLYGDDGWRNELVARLNELLPEDEVPA